MFCPKCGSQNHDGAVFCGNCGNQLSAAPATQQVPAPDIPAAGNAAVVATPSAGAPRKTSRVIVIVAVVAVIAAVSIAGFATNWFGLAGVQPKSSVDVESSSQSGNAGQSSVNDQGEQGSAKSGVEAYSWEELSRISSEIASAADEALAIEIAKKYNLCTSDGKLDGTQMKSVTLSDGTQTAVQIAGFVHDDKTDGGKAGITFIFKDAIAEHDMNSDFHRTGGWERSEMRSWLSSNVLGTLPEDLRNEIVAVDKLTNNTPETTDISTVTTTSDRLWLYSFTELCGMSDTYYVSAYNDILNAEGSEYKLFRDSSVKAESSNAILVKTFKGESYEWWERSPRPGSTDDFEFESVLPTGNPVGNILADSALGVVPGFCI